MASSRPVRICVAKQMARREPKFHQAEMLEGAGRSIRELLIIFSRGWDLRMLGAISESVLLGLLPGWRGRRILGRP